MSSAQIEEVSPVTYEEADVPRKWVTTTNNEGVMMRRQHLVYDSLYVKLPPTTTIHTAKRLGAWSYLLGTNQHETECNRAEAHRVYLDGHKSNPDDSPKTRRPKRALNADQTDEPTTEESQKKSTRNETMALAVLAVVAAKNNSVEVQTESDEPIATVEELNTLVSHLQGNRSLSNEQIDEVDQTIDKIARQLEETGNRIAPNPEQIPAILEKPFIQDTIPEGQTEEMFILEEENIQRETRYFRKVNNRVRLIFEQMQLGFTVWRVLSVVGTTIAFAGINRFQLLQQRTQPLMIGI